MKLRIIILLGVYFSYHFLGTSCHVFPRPVRRYSTDAVLRELTNPVSRIVRYTQTNPDRWLDLNTLVAGRNWTKAELLCFHGNGGWLLYPGKNLSMGYASYVRLAVVNHTEENPLCLVPSDIESLQPIGDTRYKRYSSYAFRNKYFEGSPILVSPVAGLQKQLVRSFITTGDQVSWTITETGVNDSVCINPDLHKSVICLFPDVEGLLSWSKPRVGATNNRNFVASNKCTNPKHRQLEPQSCYVTGLHKIYIDRVMTATTIGELCLAGPNTARMNLTEQMMNVILEIWGARQDRRLEPLILRKSNVKTGILERVFTVFEKACPIDVVPRQYVHLLKKVFEMHIRLAQHLDVNLTFGNHSEWLPVLKTLRDCESFLLSLTPGKEHEKWPPIMFKGYNYCEDKSNEDIVLIPKIQTAYQNLEDGKHYDPVFEQIWLILNAASSVCSNLYENYRTNFWVDLVQLFRKTYFVPLQQRWLNPNGWLSLYPVLFAGFDMEVMRKNIVHCVHRALQPAPSPGQTPNGKYAEKFSPISRVQMFQRHKENGYPVEPEDATLKPHLQQERSAKFDELQNENGIEHLNV